MRASGDRNPDYAETFVFDNDFPALIRSVPETPPSHEPLFHIEPAYGACRVVCFSPSHNLTVPELTKSQVSKVIHTWIEQTQELSRDPTIQNVQIFENKGALMGCSNPHPHSQIWATGHVPNQTDKELSSQKLYREQTGVPLLTAYLEQERDKEERVLLSNNDFTALVPYWAIWPYELLVIAHSSAANLLDLSNSEVDSLASIYKGVTRAYDLLFDVSFPYSMGIHQSPFDGMSHPEWVLHLHFYPPLLRSATVKKFMVGYEMLAEPQRDITAEMAADTLRRIIIEHDIVA